MGVNRSQSVWPNNHAGVLKSLTLGFPLYRSILKVFFVWALPHVFWQRTWSLALSVSKTAKAIDELLATRSRRDGWVGNNSGQKTPWLHPGKLTWNPKKETIVKGTFIFQPSIFQGYVTFQGGYILQNEHFEPQTWRWMESYVLLQFGDFQVNNVNFQGRTLPQTNSKSPENCTLPQTNSKSPEN